MLSEQAQTLSEFITAVCQNDRARVESMINTSSETQKAYLLNGVFVRNKGILFLSHPFTALEAACMNGNTDLIDYLIQKGANYNQGARNPDSMNQSLLTQSIIYFLRDQEIQRRYFPSAPSTIDRLIKHFFQYYNLNLNSFHEKNVFLVKNYMLQYKNLILCESVIQGYQDILEAALLSDEQLNIKDICKQLSHKREMISPVSLQRAQDALMHLKNEGLLDEAIQNEIADVLSSNLVQLYLRRRQESLKSSYSLKQLAAQFYLHLQLADISIDLKDEDELMEEESVVEDGRNAINNVQNQNRGLNCLKAFALHENRLNALVSLWRSHDLAELICALTVHPDLALDSRNGLINLLVDYQQPSESMKAFKMVYQHSDAQRSIIETQQRAIESLQETVRKQGEAIAALQAAVRSKEVTAAASPPTLFKPQ